jgi:hypothetical protein
VNNEYYFGCDKNCDSDPDCKVPEDNIVYWGLGTAIVIISGVLAYVFYHV